MKDFLPIIKARSGLFRGIEESELEKLFGCLEARKQTYRKEEYILREGEQTKVLGLVLSGSVLIVQDDVWGGRNVLPRSCRACLNGVSELLADRRSRYYLQPFLS